MYSEKKDFSRSKVFSRSLDAAKLNSNFSQIARCLLPSAPSSRPIDQDRFRRWERSAWEQTVMCNQAVGLSRCLTKVQESMVTQLKTLHSENCKVKSSNRLQHTIDELDYLVTYNSITQAMAHTMQDLSEGIFINMANLTLACRDSITGLSQSWNQTGYPHCPAECSTTHALSVSGSARPQLISRNQPRVLSTINDNYCVKSAYCGCYR